MSQPLVSIIVPVLNMHKTIARCVSSILRQDYPHLQVIIVDGSSTDTTIQQLDPFNDRIDVLVSEPDSGPYFAINKGFSFVQGSIVAILNADDFYASNDVVSRFVGAFNDSPAGIIFADIEFFDAQTHKIVRRYSSKNFRRDDLRKGKMPPHPSVFVRKSVYDLVGTYSTEYAMAADFEFILRALWHHEVVSLRIDDVVVKMQYGGRSTQTLKSMVELNNEVIRACRAWGLQTGWANIIAKWLAKLGGLSPMLAGRRQTDDETSTHPRPILGRRSAWEISFRERGDVRGSS